MKFITGTNIFLLLLQSLLANFTNCLLNQHKHFKLNIKNFVKMTKYYFFI